MLKPFDVQPVDATFGAVVTGVSLTELGQAAWTRSRTASTYALLIFPGQLLNQEAQTAFAGASGRWIRAGPGQHVRDDGKQRREAEGATMSSRSSRATRAGTPI